MSNLRDAIVRMALRRPYLYLLVTLVISIVLMEVLVEIAEHTFIKPALQQLELQFIAYVQQFCYAAADSRGNARYGKRVQYFFIFWQVRLSAAGIYTAGKKTGCIFI